MVLQFRDGEVIGWSLKTPADRRGRLPPDRSNGTEGRPRPTQKAGGRCTLDPAEKNGPRRNGRPFGGDLWKDKSSRTQKGRMKWGTDG